MRVSSVHIHKVGPFEDVSLDLDALPGVLTAIVGKNGSGKSTFMKFISKGLGFREGLAGRAFAPDAFVEGKVFNGQEWNIRHDVPLSGSGESFVTDAQGVQALESPLVSRFDAWSAKTLPPPAVLDASIFWAQKATGFLEMKRGPRAETLLAAIGADKLEERATAARALAETAAKDVAVLRGRLGDITDASVDVEGAKAGLLAAGLADADADAVLEVARTARAAAIAEAERVRCLAQAFMGRANRVGQLEATLQAGRGRLADFEARLANNRALLDRKDAIAIAQARAAELDGALEVIRFELAKHHSALEAHQREAEQHSLRANAASHRVLAASVRVEVATKRLARREEIAQAVADAERLIRDLAVAEKSATDAHDLVRELGSKQLVSAEGRVTALRASLVEIRDAKFAQADGDAIEIVQALARDTLDDDDRAVLTAVELPVEYKKAKGATLASDSILAGVRSSLARAHSVAVLAPTLEAAEGDRALAEKDAADAASETERADADRGVAQELADAANEGRLEAETRLHVTTSRRAALKADLEGADRVAQAEARVAELEPQRAQAAQDVQAATEELEGTPHAAPPPPAPDGAGAALRAQEAERAAERAHLGVETAEKALEATTAAAARRDTLRADLRREEEPLADWKRLAADIDAVRLCEIDAAGPELTELANDLLHTCAGPRFSLCIETQRSDAKGKKLLDGVDVRVFDAGSDDGKPRDGAGETFSPGEQVVLNEAISLALAMLYCRRFQVQGATLTRDETGSGLDGDNAKAYIAMLRRAAMLIGASRVFFVSHNPDTWSLADSRITVAGGRLTVSS